MITAATLDQFLGKNISAICPVGFHNANDNHCAHFVGHVLKYTFGFTCGGMVSGPGEPASLRVQELFPECKRVGFWENRPQDINPCLIFITKASNVDVFTKKMANVPKKHIGIFVDGNIWHYSNSQDKVVKQTPAQFKNHFAKPNNAMFYGEMP